MKKKLLIFGFLLVGFGAQSQVLISLLLGDKLNSDGLEFGLEGGYNWSVINGLDAKKSLSVLNLGFYFDIRIKNQWSLYTGVLVRAKQGVDHLSDNDLTFLEAHNYPEPGTYSQVINYFLVPALLKYKWKSNIYAEGGMQFGLTHGAWVEYNSNIEGRDARIKEENQDRLNRIDAGAMAGFGYQWKKVKNMTFGVKYYYGFVNVYKGVSGTTNNSLFLKINIPIGAKEDK